MGRDGDRPGGGGTDPERAERDHLAFCRVVVVVDPEQFAVVPVHTPEHRGHGDVGRGDDLHRRGQRMGGIGPAQRSRATGGGRRRDRPPRAADRTRRRAAACPRARRAGLDRSAHARVKPTRRRGRAAIRDPPSRRACRRRWDCRASAAGQGVRRCASGRCRIRTSTPGRRVAEEQEQQAGGEGEGCLHHHGNCPRRRPASLTDGAHGSARAIGVDLAHSFGGTEMAVTSARSWRKRTKLPGRECSERRLGMERHAGQAAIPAGTWIGKGACFRKNAEIRN